MSWDGVHALVGRARAGDRDAWTDLCALAHEYLLDVAQKLLGPGWPHQTARDVCQQTWLKFFETIGDFRGGADDAQTAAILRAWLARTATQLAKNCFRDNGAKKRKMPPRRRRLEPGWPDDSTTSAVIDLPGRDPTPSHAGRLAERRARVERALGTLPDPTGRHVAELHYLDDWPLRRVADHLGLTYHQVRYELRQVKRLLHNELRSGDDDPRQP